MRDWLDRLRWSPRALPVAIAAVATFVIVVVVVIVIVVALGDDDEEDVVVEALRSQRSDIVEVAMFGSPHPRQLQILEGECRVREPDGVRGPFDVQLVERKRNTIAICPFATKEENEGACERHQRFELVCKSNALIRVGRTTRRIGDRLRFDVRGKGLTVVAQLDIEDYVDAVVRAEHPRAPFEAQRAQAIVARTFALHAQLDPRHTEAPLCDTTHCQVYQGNVPGGPEGPSAAHTTGGLVLLDEAGLIPPTFFHSTCGGHTLDAEAVWPGSGTYSIVGVEDVDDEGRAWCRNSKYFRWRKTVSDTELAAAFSAAVGRSLDGRTLRVWSSADGLTWRVADKSGTKRVRGSTVHRELGRRIGWDHILSPRFVAKRVGKKFRLKGSGLGHAVGLCQTGAEARAEAGQTAEIILQDYFPRLSLTSLDLREDLAQ